jgi:hypothetical protein
VLARREAIPDAVVEVSRPLARRRTAVKYRAMRLAYLMAMLVTFVIASGAGHKFGGD